MAISPEMFIELLPCQPHDQINLNPKSIHKEDIAQRTELKLSHEGVGEAKANQNHGMCILKLRIELLEIVISCFPFISVENCQHDRYNYLNQNE